MSSSFIMNMGASESLCRRLVPTALSFDEETHPMFKGNELIHKRSLFLYYLYERGAIARNSAVDGAHLQRDIEVNEEDLRSLCRNLSDAGLVKKLGGGWVIDEASGCSSKFWLTGAGLIEAAAIAEAVRQHVERASKGPIGLQTPGKNE